MTRTLSIRPALWGIAILFAALTFTACHHTLNIGLTSPPPGFQIPHPGGGGNNNGTPVVVTAVTAAKPGGGTIYAGDQVQIMVTFTGDITPFIVAYGFTGNVVDPATIPAPRTVTASPDQITVTTLASAGGQSCTCNVLIADHDGNLSNKAATITVANQPVNPTNHDPTITAVSDDANCQVTVTVADQDGDDVVVTPAAPASMEALDGTQTITGGNGAFTFSFAPKDVLAGASGNIDFTADDGNGGSASIGANLLCAGITLASDTLYAIPTRPTISVGSPLTILVATGVPAHPFEYLNGVRVTAPQASGINFVGGSLNVGAVGGAAGDADGFWTAMAPSSFLLPPDNFIVRSDAGGGLYGIDFNITPLGGSNQTSASGALFNFQVTFDTPGTYDLGFQDINVVDRTFYQDDSQSTDFFWGDITNSHAGVRSSVVVTP